MLDHDAGAAREQWYGAQEAARFLGVHRSTLHIAVRQGLIVPDHYTPGGHARFTHETLEAFRVRLMDRPATSDSASQSSLRVLAQVAGLLATPTEPEALASAALAGIRRVLLEMEMCGIAVRTGDPRDRYRMRLLAHQDFPGWVVEDYNQLRSTFRFATTAALRTLGPQICEDTAKDTLPSGTEHLLRSLHLGAYAVQPLVAGDEPLGAIICLYTRPHAFSDTERTFLRGIADELASALTSTGQFRQLSQTLTTARALMRQALATRAGATRRTTGDSEADGVAAGQALGNLFAELSGAEELCALGFSRDLTTTNPHLLALACQACAGDDVAQAQWMRNGITYTGVGASVPLDTGLRAGVSAAWPGKRAFVEADHALLVTFAGAYIVAVSAPSAA